MSSQVEQAPRRPRHHIDAGFERRHLRLVGPATVDGEHAGAQALAGDDEVRGDLNREFTGRDDDQCPRAMVVDQVDELEQRSSERKGLARAGSGLADQVGASQRQRNRQCLNGERDGDADGF